MVSRFSVPALSQRLLVELRHVRKQAGLTQKQVASAMDWSLSKMLRIEAGRVGISATDLRALLGYYNITDPHRTQEFLTLAQHTHSRK